MAQGQDLRDGGGASLTALTCGGCFARKCVRVPMVVLDLVGRRILFPLRSPLFARSCSFLDFVFWHMASEQVLAGDLPCLRASNVGESSGPCVCRACQWLAIGLHAIQWITEACLAAIGHTSWICSTMALSTSSRTAHELIEPGSGPSHWRNLDSASQSATCTLVCARAHREHVQAVRLLAGSRFE